MNNISKISQEFRILFENSVDVYIVDYMGNMKKKLKTEQELVIEPYGIMFVKVKN